LKIVNGNVVLNEDSTRTASLGANAVLYVADTKTLTGTVDGIAAGQGTLVLEGGIVDAAVGNGQKLAAVNYTGANASKITGVLKTAALNVTGAGVLTVGGVATVDALNIATTGAAGELVIAANSTFGEVNYTGATDSTITGALTTPTLNLTGDGNSIGKLIVDGAITSGTANVLVTGTIAANNAKIEYQAATDLVNFTVAEGITGATQILNKGGAIFIAKSNINTAIQFANAADDTLTINDTFQATKAITTSANNQGKVAYVGVATITANIGENNLSLTGIQLSNTGTANTINAAVYSPITFGNLANQTLTLGTDTGVGSVNGLITLGAQAGQQLILNNASSVTGNIQLGAAANQTVTLNGSSVTGNIALAAGDNQAVKLTGASTVTGNIALNVNKAQNVTLSDSAKVVGTVAFGANADQYVTLSGSSIVDAVNFAKVGTLNLNGTSTVSSIIGAEAGTVVATQGSNLGNVNALATKVTASGVTFSGTTYNAAALNVTGNNTVTNTNNQPVTFNNLVTSNGAIIDARSGSQLTLAGDATSIGNGTNLVVKSQDSALNLSGLAADKFGATNIIIANAEEKLHSVSFAELFKGIAPTKLVIGVDNADVAAKFTVKNGVVFNHIGTYDDTNKNIVVTTALNQNAVDRLGSVIDQSKSSGEETVAMFAYADRTGNLDTARQKAAAIETTDVAISTVETVTSNVVGILNAIDNPGSNAALAPSAGEDYNEQGINAFVTPFIAKGTTKQNGDVAGSNYNAAGANLGLTAGINEDNTHLGLALTFANSTSKFKDAKDGDKAKGETKSLTIFGDHALGNNVVVQGILTLGVTDFKTTQTLFLGKYDGKYTTKFASLLAKVGYNLNTGGSFKAMPYVGLRYDTYRDGSYDLKADKFTNVSVSSKTTNKYIASIGAKLTGSTEADGTHFAPFADVSFGYNFGKKSSTKSIDIGNFNPNAKYSDSDKTIVNGRLGVEARMEGGLNATLGGGLDLIGSKTTVYHGSLKLGYKF
jgi:hypothetical protein